MRKKQNYIFQKCRVKTCEDFYQPYIGHSRFQDIFQTKKEVEKNKNLIINYILDKLNQLKYEVVLYKLICDCSYCLNGEGICQDMGENGKPLDFDFILIKLQ